MKLMETLVDQTAVRCAGRAKTGANSSEVFTKFAVVTYDKERDNRRECVPAILSYCIKIEGRLCRLPTFRNCARPPHVSVPGFTETCLFLFSIARLDGILPRFEWHASESIAPSSAIGARRVRFGPLVQQFCDVVCVSCTWCC